MSDGGWERPERIPPLIAGEVQVWWIDPDELVARCLPLLNAEERARAERYRVETARTEFVVGRGCLRVLLGRALGVAPETIAFAVGAYGKPMLARHVGIGFNVSHTRGAILIAIGVGSRLGTDVERMEESPELAQIATDSFTARERRIMDSASTRSDWLHAFFRCWTQKEAVTKADGRGLNLPLQSFEVPIAPISAKRGGSHVQVETDGSTVEYLVSELALGEGYAAALAVQPENATVRRYRFSPSLLSGSAA